MSNNVEFHQKDTHFLSKGQVNLLTSMQKRLIYFQGNGCIFIVLCGLIYITNEFLTCKNCNCGFKHGVVP